MPLDHDPFDMKARPDSDKKRRPLRNGVIRISIESSDQTEVSDGIENAILIDRIGDVVGDLFHVVAAVAHDDADTRIFNHVEIVVRIAKRHGLLFFDTEALHDCFDAFDLAGSGQDDVGSAVVPE